MEYNFLWSTPNSGAPIVSIAIYGITFNTGAIEILNKPAKIMMGFDEDKKIIGFKPTTTDNVQAFPFMEKERKGYIRIGNKEFIKYISSKTGNDFKKSIKYLPNWDKNEQILIIDLNCPLDEEK
jgi:hypothetical protein